MLEPTVSFLPHWLVLYGNGQLNWLVYGYWHGKIAPFVSPTGGLSQPTGFLLIDTLVYGDFPAFFNALENSDPADSVVIRVSPLDPDMNTLCQR